jgi:hypothetical protein
MSRYAFDNVLVPINPADGHSLHSPVVAGRGDTGAGCRWHEVVGAGRLLDVRPEELLRYTASLADTAIVRCSSLAVRQNPAVATAFTPMSRTSGTRWATGRPDGARHDYYKAGP